MGKGNYRHLRSPEIETQKNDQKEMMSLFWITTGILTVVTLDFRTLYSAMGKVINHLSQRHRIQQELQHKSSPTSIKTAEQTARGEKRR